MYGAKCSRAKEDTVRQAEEYEDEELGAELVEVACTVS